MHDKGKAHARQVTAVEMPISALPANPPHVLRGQKCHVLEVTLVDSSNEKYEDEDGDKEDSGEEEVTPKKSDLSRTTSMPRVHVEVPLPPKKEGCCKSNAPPITATGTVMH
jgi:hypothetical protein